MSIVREYFPDDVWGVINEYARDKEPMRLCHEEMFYKDRCENARMTANRMYHGHLFPGEWGRFHVGIVAVWGVDHKHSEPGFVKLLCNTEIADRFDGDDICYKRFMSVLKQYEKEYGEEYVFVFTPKGIMKSHDLVTRGYFNGFIKHISPHLDYWVEMRAQKFMSDLFSVPII